MLATEVIKKIEGIKNTMDSLPKGTESANTYGYLLEYRQLLE